MSQSTDHAESQRQFAAEVLQELLRHIAIKNIENAETGHYVYRVSHAWTEGPMMHVVYKAPPLDITWGLVRDTRESLIDPGPWNDFDDPAFYYYLLDFEEGWPGPLSRQPGDDPDTIHWRGDQREGLPERLSDIPVSYRHTPPPIPAAETRQETPPVIEPRWYANPR
ncbi:hypothetical protein MSIMFB_04677 [Mycobacterium simulans]|uniref:Uncharacterized protein n=1 Tax=Mycobacterium simulans TaxID=627089 RepID=A0A7Z7NBW7_9MYCO|nr:hypothetical protein [Mycobacterium simulans]SOJ57200.1 hypothetical protein MSIMFB_04677 [Mycobacterium simulans]